MNTSNHKRTYKNYLQPNSVDPIPSSTWYRHKKARRIKEQIPSVRTDNFICNNEETKIETQNIEQHTKEEEEESLIEMQNMEKENGNILVSLKDEELEVSSTNFDDFFDDGKLRPTLENIMESLEIDIDNIGNKEIDINNEEQNEHADDDDDDDDFFFDAIDDEDLLKNVMEDEKDEVNSCSGKTFASLEDLLENEENQKPIKTVADKSVAEIVIMIIKFSLVHCLCLTAISDLFKMINCIFAESILPDTRYLIDKIFYPKQYITLHAICTECGSYIGIFKRTDKFLKCNLCKSEMNVKNYVYKDFFVSMDTSVPISKLIEANNSYFDYIMYHRKHRKGIIEDIFDGKMYRDFLKTLSATDRHNYVTVTFNTDGAPLFKSSKYSIWPIYLMVNELPYNVRSNELILAGLWFGKDKPNMNVFLSPFVESMNKLSSRGIKCNINNSDVRVKVFPLVACVDSVARAPVQGFVQFNGAFGCGHCLHPGEYVKNNSNNPRSGNIKYPLMNKTPKERNATSTIKHMEKAVNTGKSVFGVKNFSNLINLEKFDIIRGCVPDPMHCCSGVAKQIVTQLFGTKNKAGLLPKSVVLEVDKIISGIKVPNQIARLTRPFSEREFWKAREWENWTLYYSLPVFLLLVPTQYYEHWALYVEAIYLLLQDSITVTEVDWADQLLLEFVGRSQILYSKVSMTFNIHLLLHLANSVYYWGPLWAHNAYPFESENGKLLKAVKAAKGIHHQICRRISLKYTYFSLKDHIYPFLSTSVRHYCNNTGATIIQKTVKLTDIRYFGSSFTVDEIWLRNLNLTPEKSFAYKKMVKNGCLYLSSLKENQRSDNSFAKMIDGQYVKITRFIIDRFEKKEFTIVQNIKTENTLKTGCPMLKKIIHIENHEKAVLTKNISKICVHVNVNDIQYLCAIPNLHVY